MRGNLLWIQYRHATRTIEAHTIATPEELHEREFSTYLTAGRLVVA